MTFKVTIQITIEREVENLFDIQKIIEQFSEQKVTEVKPERKRGFQVLLHDGKLIRHGRPAFSSSTYKNIPAIPGIEDRRHILHGATQITDVLIDSFNRILSKDGMEILHITLDKIMEQLSSNGYDIKIQEDLNIENKAKEIITIAFGREENLVAGLAVQNRGIEIARKAINSIKKSIDFHNNEDLKDSNELKEHILSLIDTNINHSTGGKISLYKNWIMEVLKKSVSKAETRSEMISILHDFEFSCTLDIEHDKTTKAQNIWGLTMANKLHRAIKDHNEEAIFQILLGE